MVQVASAPSVARVPGLGDSTGEEGLAMAVLVALYVLSGVAAGLVAVFVVPLLVRSARTGQSLLGYADALAPLEPLLKDRTSADAERLSVLLGHARRAVQVLHQLLRIATVSVLFRSLPLGEAWARVRRRR